MPQMGFLDLSDRYARLDAKTAPLAEITCVVPWEEFRPALEWVWCKPEGDRNPVRDAVFPTSTHGKSHSGDKNHVNVGRMHRLVRRYHVSDAAVHDRQAADHLLMQGNTGLTPDLRDQPARPKKLRMTGRAPKAA